MFRESFYEGSHSYGVCLGLSMGVISFIVSELFFFVSFFWMYFYYSLSPDFCFGLFDLLLDLFRESFYEGSHSYGVCLGLSMGVISFIVSELFFFVSFFWMYFYYSLSPDFCFGFVWPPFGFVSLSYMDIPFLNTLILLSSGFFITWSHFGLLIGSFSVLFYSYFFCLFSGSYFLLVQMYEYYNLSFDFSDGVFGCSFFILTGFHGFHVLVGFFFLLVNYFRFISSGFSFLSFFGFEYSIWYWHFVDLIWLFLYLFLYWWGM